MAERISFDEARGPDGMRLYAIGDVHGRRDLLEAMHARIAEEIAEEAPADWRVVHLGDYVDRGPESRGVLELLINAQKRDARHIALCGNHDLAFLDFISGPGDSSLFQRFGGAATAVSYGLDADFGSAERVERTRRALAAKVPARHRRFLAGLERSVMFGDFFFCHAGIRPGVALDAQDPHDLVWIRREFLNAEELHPKVVVHGHTPSAVVELRPNRVNLDTAAYETGVLSGLVVDGDFKRLIQVTG